MSINTNNSVTVGTNHFDMLPNEVTQQILGYMDIPTLLKTTSLVNKRFNGASGAVLKQKLDEYVNGCPEKWAKISKGESSFEMEPFVRILKIFCIVNKRQSLPTEYSAAFLKRYNPPANYPTQSRMEYFAATTAVLIEMPKCSRRHLPLDRSVHSYEFYPIELIPPTEKGVKECNDRFNKGLIVDKDIDFLINGAFGDLIFDTNPIEQGDIPTLIKFAEVVSPSFLKAVLDRAGEKKLRGMFIGAVAKTNNAEKLKIVCG